MRSCPPIGATTITDIKKLYPQAHVTLLHISITRLDRVNRKAFYLAPNYPPQTSKQRRDIVCSFQDNRRWIWWTVAYLMSHDGHSKLANVLHQNNQPLWPRISHSSGWDLYCDCDCPSGRCKHQLSSGSFFTAPATPKVVVVSYDALGGKMMLTRAHGPESSV